MAASSANNATPCWSVEPAQERPILPSPLPEAASDPALAAGSTTSSISSTGFERIGDRRQAPAGVVRRDEMDFLVVPVPISRRGLEVYGLLPIPGRCRPSVRPDSLVPIPPLQIYEYLLEASGYAPGVRSSMPPSSRCQTTEHARQNEAVKSGQTPAAWTKKPAKNRQKIRARAGPRSRGGAYGYKNHVNADAKYPSDPTL